MKIDSKELKDFIKSALDAIRDGVKDSEDFHIDGPVTFSLAIINKSERGGGLKIYVTNASAKYKKEQISKLEFRVKTIPKK
ncbi:MAG: hypothetical protein A3B30_01860 [Candidatus Komeilibacteria bacterium RIFCSPLOWO2_01_FULL_52_15]|uniref:Uncharacterized protein n=2 Tax=Candidatus Komeiliibacteriota TaxID=1817908 RepID=A0A1G2BTS7_9BACT|nr:MAG: hypothetical protein A2677_02225 [Candidatus Komeilibacteria bacterium RIFCSPHIGHO2_01_FULL_52_14]OGY91760.1 MAG: hypothetical protein A3B30_01860 [Candidatus Komeilibacteria bacterium RIFCSPLOWO2_01_FULL_52_15]